MFLTAYREAEARASFGEWLSLPYSGAPTESMLLASMAEVIQRVVDCLVANLDSKAKSYKNRVRCMMVPTLALC